MSTGVRVSVPVSVPHEDSVHRMLDVLPDVSPSSRSGGNSLLPCSFLLVCLCLLTCSCPLSHPPFCPLKVTPLGSPSWLPILGWRLEHVFTVNGNLWNSSFFCPRVQESSASKISIHGSNSKANRDVLDVTSKQDWDTPASRDLSCICCPCWNVLFCFLCWYLCPSNTLWRGRHHC